MLKDDIKITTLRGPSINVEVPSTNLFNRFQTRVLQHPNKLAVVLDDQSLTYGELYSLVSSCASRLLQVVHPGDIVCQCVERSIEMVIGILAIFLCNTVYCPLSPKDPIERRRALLNETRAKVILVHQATDHLFSDDDGIDYIKLRIDEQESIESVTDTMVTEDLASLAFIVFTSGSTGIPKGVPIGHANFNYYLASMCHENYILANDIILQISQDTFDAHLQEILGAVLVGGTCILLRSRDGAHLNAAHLTQTMCQHQVTFTNLVPSLAIALIDYLSRLKQRFSSSLRIVISTG
jgi:non-ribosomal peptide synthetase component F